MKKYCVVMLFSCMLFVSGAGAALYSTTDALNGSGGFEFDGGMGPWAKWTGSSEPVTIDSTYKNAGTYSLKLGPSTASSKNNRAETTVVTVANRSYKIIVPARFASGSSPSYGRVKLGASVWDTTMNITWGSGYFKENLLYYTTSATETSCLLQIGTYSNSANDNLWIDDVKLFQEIALPNVDAITGSGATWTLTNAGGRIGDNLQLVAFDPTATVSYVSGFDVGQITTTRNSDNQLVVQFANSLAGAVNLMVTNPNGDAGYMLTIPEPATVCILSLGLLGLIRNRK